MYSYLILCLQSINNGKKVLIFVNIISNIHVLFAFFKENRYL